MKTTRRDFLKGLFATGAALAVAPHLLVELAHGASDLTPQERDVAAEVMGLRHRQWPGYGPSPTGLSVRITNAEEGEIVVSGLPSEHWFDAQRYLQGAPDSRPAKTMRRTTWADGVKMTDRIDDWDFKHGNLVVFLDAKTELLIDGEWVSVGETRAPEGTYAVGALAEWERELLYGVPDGALPTGVIDSGQTAHVKFVEEETVWKRRSIIVPVMESAPWPDGSPRFGQMEVLLLANGEPDWDYTTRAMRERAERWIESGSTFFDRGLYEYGT